MNDSDLERDSDSDRDRDIATILQYLIRSGQVRIIAATSPHLYNEGSDEELTSSRSSPKVDHHPDTSSLKGSDLSQAILLSTGALNDRHSNSPPGMIPLPSMLRSRELGMNGRHHFTLGDRCQIMQRVIPNKKDTLDRYHGKVFCGTFTKNGDVFMSAAQDYCIRFYDTSSGLFKLKRTVEARDVGWSILDTAVSPDGNNFSYCSWSECIHICNISGEQEIHEALPLYPEERRFCVFAIRFSQDGREILCGANDQFLYVFNREQNKRTLRIYSHEDDVNTVAFADNTSQILFSGGDDGICKVWDRRTMCEFTPKPVGILAGHEDGITYVDSKGDGRHLITNSKDQTIKLWDMRAFSPSSCIENAYKAVKSHNWDYRWQRVPSSLNRHKRKLPGDTSLMTYRGHSVLQTLIRCHFSPETTTGQSYIYTGCAQGRVVVYDVLTGKIKATLKGHKGCVRDVSWHPYRNEIMSSSWDGTIVKWTFNKTEIDSDSDEATILYDSREGEASESTQGLRRSQRLAEQRRKQESEIC
ncbi:DDB1- and CUL4-associated factor 11 [Trichonephila inaurata madagascariensis]|uniref:DDB1- and CUL4-associated factor 11 n=1 Tax=Trichonephila inaurata madagascariensis TaxID=2747483 RepID=A0A8X6YJW9_9ARAC|nr:DDB1- and CUL4-associated factor 11 [Trichonephila inaurata madagascariensis]GFY72864.1 DDB1- and CUL4-associated factor 11 [Trichonephila inaurata madagascariensis]